MNFILGDLVDFILGDDSNTFLWNARNDRPNDDLSHNRRSESSVYYFLVNIGITLPDEEGKMEIDSSKMEDSRNLHVCYQKAKVYGPALLPVLKHEPETTSCDEVTKPQCDDEKERERKKNRNKRRIEQRNKKVLYGRIALFLLM